MNRASTALLVALAIGGLQPRVSCAQRVLPPDGVCAYDWRQHYEQLTRYLDAPLASALGTDHQTTAVVPGSLAGVTETWYVAAGAQGGQTAPFHRLSADADGEAMDSAFPSEPGYSFDASLGFPWSVDGAARRAPAGTAETGMAPLLRWLRPDTGDHWTRPSKPPAGGYVLDASYDGASAPVRLGYPRFGNAPSKAAVLGTTTCTPGAAPTFTGAAYGSQFLDNGLLRVDFNRVWGNAIGRITQVATCRQIVSEPIGDMVQTVVRFFDGRLADGTPVDDRDCRNPNPTQSGGAWANTPSAPQTYRRTEYWMGSPVLSEERTASGAVQVLTSVVRPLDFATNGAAADGAIPWAGADPAKPLAWMGYIERRDALGCMVGAGTRRDVVATRSRLMLALDNAGAAQDVGSLNTYWLKATDLVAPSSPVVWDFQMECRNLRTGAMRRLLAHADGSVRLNETDDRCGEDDGDPWTPPDDHALLVTRKDGSFGYAVVRLGLVVGESTTVTFRCAAVPCDTADKGAVIVQPYRTQFTFPPRSTVTREAWSAPLDSFLVVNNRAALLTRSDEIRADGGACLQ